MYNERQQQLHMLAVVLSTVQEVFKLPLIVNLQKLQHSRTVSECCGALNLGKNVRVFRVNINHHLM